MVSRITLNLRAQVYGQPNEQTSNLNPLDTPLFDLDLDLGRKARMVWDCARHMGIGGLRGIGSKGLTVGGSEGVGLELDEMNRGFRKSEGRSNDW